MFASGLIDAVVSTLPTHEHARYAVWALRAGLHVFSEKPMARTSSECATMLATAKRARRVLMVGQCIRFWPGWDTVKEYPYLYEHQLFRASRSTSFWGLASFFASVADVSTTMVAITVIVTAIFLTIGMSFSSHASILTPNK